MTRWQAVIFDLDDTLYPERAFVLSGFRAVSQWGEKHLDIPADKGFKKLKSLYIQGVRGDTFNRWLMPYGYYEEGIIRELVRVYRSHEPNLEPFEDVIDVLDSFRSTYKLGLISDGYLKVQRNKLDALRLERYFNAIIFPDTWGRKYWKPHPRPYLESLANLNATPAHTVYVGDNPKKDFIGAKKVGLKTIRVRRENGEYSDIDPPSSEHAPDLNIASLNQLNKALAKLENV